MLIVCWTTRANNESAGFSEEKVMKRAVEGANREVHRRALPTTRRMVPSSSRTWNRGVVHHQNSRKKTYCGIRWMILLIVILGILLILLLTFLSLRISLMAHQSQESVSDLSHMGGPMIGRHYYSNDTLKHDNVMMDSSHHSSYENHNYFVQERNLQRRQGKTHRRDQHDHIPPLSGTAKTNQRKDPAMNLSEGQSLVVSETVGITWRQSAQSANTCVEKGEDQCRAVPCGNEVSTNIEDNSMSFYSGLIYRPDNTSNPIRGTAMQLSGHAKSGSGCAISHRYQFLYVHVLKSGGMTLKAFLKQGLCGSTNMPCRGDDHSELLQIVDCGKAIQQYPHYFVWSFVRNPFSRMYSAYAMALNYRNPSPRPTNKKGRPYSRKRHPNRSDPVGGDHNSGMLPEFDFATFVLAAELGPRQQSVYAKYQGASRNTTLEQQPRQLLETIRSDYHATTTRITTDNKSWTMEQLTSDVWANATDERLLAPERQKLSRNMKARRSMTHMDLVHCQPQSKFLFDANDCPVFDFVGHLESFEGDLRHLATNLLESPELVKHFQTIYGNNTAKELMLTVNDNNMKDKSTSFGTKQKQATLGGNLQIAYQDAALQGHDVQQAVSKEFARDFRLLGYDPSIVPQ